MSLKTYSVYFRPDDTGLTPTFAKFTAREGGADLSAEAPAITEVGGPGGSFGEYKFSYDASEEISFVVDGGASITSANDRYVRGVIGPDDSRLGELEAGISLLTKYQEGRWKIHKTGADANRMVLYDTDGVTVLKKFDLKTLDGAATFTNPAERIPV